MAQRRDRVDEYDDDLMKEWLWRENNGKNI